MSSDRYDNFAHIMNDSIFFLNLELTDILYDFSYLLLTCQKLEVI